MITSRPIGVALLTLPMLAVALGMAALAFADPPSRLVRGYVTDVTAEQVSLKTDEGVLDVAIDGDTEYAYDDGRAANPGDVVVGSLVEVVLDPAVNALRALSVIIVTQEEPTETETPDEMKFWLEGVVAEKSASSITIESAFETTVIAVDDATEITLETGDRGKLSDITAGDHVSAWGVFDGEAYLAMGIQVGELTVIEDPVPGEMTGVVVSTGDASVQVSMSGFIADIAITDATKFVDGPIFTDEPGCTDPSGEDPDEPVCSDEVDSPGEAGGAPGGLEPGDTVQALVEFDGEATTALAIGIVSREDNGYLVGGVFVTLGDEGMTVETSLGAREYTLAGDVRVVRMSGGTASLDDIVEGDYLVLTVDSAADPRVSEIQIADVMYESVKGKTLSGTVAGFNRQTGVARVRSAGGAVKRVHVSKSTHIAHANGASARVADLRRGRYIEFDGAATGDGVMAASVRLFDRRMEAGVLGRRTGDAGVILRVAKDTRVTVVLTESTRVTRANGSKGSAADLGGGTPVLVDGVGSGKRIVATRVRVLESRGDILRLEGGVTRVTRAALVLESSRGAVRMSLGLRTLGSRANGAPLVATSLKPGARVLVIGIRGGHGVAAVFVRLLGEAGPPVRG